MTGGGRDGGGRAMLAPNSPIASVSSFSSYNGLYKAPEKPSGTLSRDFQIPSHVHSPLRDSGAALHPLGPLRLGELPLCPGLFALPGPAGTKDTGKVQGWATHSWSFSVLWGNSVGRAWGCPESQRALSSKRHSLCSSLPPQVPSSPSSKVSSRSPSSRSPFLVTGPSVI